MLISAPFLKKRADIIMSYIHLTDDITQGGLNVKTSE